MFTKHGLNAWVIVYVKDKGGNLSTMTIILTFVVSCKVLGLTTAFVGSCHVNGACHSIIEEECKDPFTWWTSLKYIIPMLSL